MNIFTQDTINTRKQRTAAGLASLLKNDDLVMVFAGEPIQKPGGHDQTYNFLPHPDYFWLTGSRRPHGVSVFTKAEGWIDFVKPISRDELIWEGGGVVIPGRPVSELDAWIAQQSFGRIFSLGQVGQAHLQKPANEDEFQHIQEGFNQVRRIKDAAEVKLVRDLAGMANQGYERIKKFIRPGVTERQIQLEYEMAVLSAGAEKMPYDSIVGTGTNGAILHAIPTQRIVKDGDLVLIDAGADVQDYCVDVTRVFAANGTMSAQQKSIFDLVLKAQSESIALCRPGVEWHDVHKASARVFADGLRALNILKGDAQAALEAGAVSVFFPHGVGHMVGLRVRDVGGKFTKDPRKAFGVRVRVDLPMQPGFLMTVEPGLYFIKALIEDADTRAKYAEFIDWTEVEKWREFGGIRLEDDIHITPQGPENLTSVISK